jgi:predicted O-methyltransferase YrrM
VRPGGLILAHNVNMVDEYVRRVSSDPNLETVFYMQGGGLSITLKKR